MTDLKGKIESLRFGGSVWCNLDVALRNVDQLFARAIKTHNLSVIEWYILRALYEQDGQHASELARSVGRAATSFTPNLDKLQEKGYVERRSDTSDRRAVRIFLTDKAKKNREQIVTLAHTLDENIASLFSEEDYDAFTRVIAKLQTINLD